MGASLWYSGADRSDDGGQWLSKAGEDVRS
jgi:hypothetical protein